MRGETYLALGDAQPSAGEFQGFIDHRGMVANFSWGALARVGLARAYALQGHRSDPRRVSGFLNARGRTQTRQGLYMNDSQLLTRMGFSVVLRC
jgi:hypothetical protein